MSMVSLSKNGTRVLEHEPKAWVAFLLDTRILWNLALVAKKRPTVKIRRGHFAFISTRSAMATLSLEIPRGRIPPPPTHTHWRRWENREHGRGFYHKSIQIFLFRESWICVYLGSEIVGRSVHWRIQPPAFGVGGGELGEGSYARVPPKRKTPRIKPTIFGMGPNSLSKKCLTLGQHPLSSFSEFLGFWRKFSNIGTPYYILSGHGCDFVTTLISVKK